MTTWHDIPGLTPHQCDTLRSLERRLAHYRCDPGRINELLMAHASFYAGVQR